MSERELARAIWRLGQEVENLKSAENALLSRIAEVETENANRSRDKIGIFCPNCEKDTECEQVAELYECKECGEDFAKYIVGRTEPSNSDVSVTENVLTTIKRSQPIENHNQKDGEK